MKTERRQELRTNELGSFLLDATDWAKKYSFQLTVGIAVVVVSVVGIRFLRISSANSTDAAVVTLMELSFEEEDAPASFGTLDQLIADAPDRDIKMSALLREGTAALNLARTSESDPTQYLDRAERAFQELRESYPERMPVVAMALESLASIEADRFVLDHDLAHRDKARGYLEQLQNAPLFKGSPFQTDAAERLLGLEDVFQVIEIAEALPTPPEPETPAAATPTQVVPGTPQLRRLPTPPPGYEQVPMPTATDKATEKTTEKALENVEKASPEPATPDGQSETPKPTDDSGKPDE